MIAAVVTSDGEMHDCWLRVGWRFTFFSTPCRILARDTGRRITFRNKPTGCLRMMGELAGAGRAFNGLILVSGKPGYA